MPFLQLFSCLLLFFWHSSINASIFFVEPIPSPEPCDSYIGSYENPFPDIACAFSRITQKYSIINLKPGQYNGVNNTNLQPQNGMFTSIVGNSTSGSDVVIQCSSFSFLPLNNGTRFSQRFLVSQDNAIIHLSMFSIRNCHSNVEFQKTSLSPTVIENIIDGITGGNFILRNFGGGALLFSNTSVIISNLRFYYNSAYRGGAIFGINNSTITIENSMFSENLAILQGGAMAFDSCDVTIINSTFYSNNARGISTFVETVSGAGGALYYGAFFSDHTLFSFGNHFENNSAAHIGGAVAIQSAALLPFSYQSVSDLYIRNLASGDSACLSTQACDVRGGAIFLSIQSAQINGSTFVDNRVHSETASEFSQGGAIFSSNLIEAKDSSFLNVSIVSCTFMNNSVDGYGGALYIYNQKLQLASSLFQMNFAGNSNQLFLDLASSGGALWYSNNYEGGVIESCLFHDNYVWGGWGGAIFATDTPRNLTIYNSTFFSNFAISSYTFEAQGGAIKATNNLALVLENCFFANNSVYPHGGIAPLTYSGNGGAVYGATISAYVSNCIFKHNYALTGQFDAGSSGGAMQLENVQAGIISNSTFISNGAAGYFGYSTYASSGAGGAILLKFSNIKICQCIFTGNWVSVGGTQISAGGAIAVFFEFPGPVTSNYRVQILNSDFTNNTALSQTCYQTGSRAGQGGALAIVGITRSYLMINHCNFSFNTAVSPEISSMASFGGGVAITVGSNVTLRNCRFTSNYAKHGLGNDIASVTGAQQGLSYVKSLGCTFISLNKQTSDNIDASIGSLNNLVCLTLGELFSKTTTTAVRLLWPSELVKSYALDVDSFDPKSSRRFNKIKSDIASNILELNDASLIVVKKRRTLLKLFTAELLQEEFYLRHGNFNNSRTYRQLISLRFSVGFVAPSIVINNGIALFTNPTFDGAYHIFIGDIGYVIGGGETTRFAQPCEAAIYSNNKALSRGLLITAIGATVAIANTPSPSFLNSQQFPLVLTELHVYNSTLYVTNNITVISNSTIDASTISQITSSLSFAPAFFNLPSNVLPVIPVIRFLGPLFTGASHTETSMDPVYLRDDDTIGTAVDLKSQEIVIDGCAIYIYDVLQLTSPINAAALPDVDLSFVAIRLVNNAHINITTNATLRVLANTVIVASSANSPALTNDGIIVLLGASGSSSPSIVSQGDSETKKSSDSQFISANSPLSIFGSFIQSVTGSIEITLNSSYQTSPVISLSSNHTLLGKLIVGFNGDPELTLYNPVAVSSFLIASFAAVKPNPAGKLQLVSLLRGLDFATDLRPIVSDSGTVQFHQSLVISSIACSNIIEYYYNMQTFANTQYPCYICLLNTSCSYCAGQCVDAGSSLCDSTGDNSATFINSCCEYNCHAPNGICVAAPNSENTQFSCECDEFYEGSTCINLSLLSTLLITASVFLVSFALITFLYYRYSKGQKSVVLEELRQGLLFNNDTSTDPAYIQAMQQALILKDVFVKYDEIKIESQIGEGSFGVVYKATFRCAQVAVKQMRSMFLELTEADIEGFRKEAYMMSRLRHPNIVLVMGISLIDKPAPLMAMKKSRFTEEASNRDFEKEKDKDKDPGKTICIITEYLEQGSLADILYGPSKLPQEIWSYELILTCSLQAARGMLYLHSHSPQICHRDLKSSNLVVDDHWVVKVTDFGMSRIVPEKIQDVNKGVDKVDVRSNHRTISCSEIKSKDINSGTNARASSIDSLGGTGQSTIANSSSRRKLREGSGTLSSHNLEMTSNLGTTAWCAPELFTVSSTTQYSVKVDVYSFGMVLWEIWEKKRPFEQFSSRFDVIDAIISGKRPPISDNCPPAYRSLIQRCWQGESERRPTFQYIVRYLKDELARVKRQRNMSVGSAGSFPYNFSLSSNYFRDLGVGSPGKTTADFNDSGSAKIDTSVSSTPVSGHFTLGLPSGHSALDSFVHRIAGGLRTQSNQENSNNSTTSNVSADSISKDKEKERTLFLNWGRKSAVSDSDALLIVRSSESSISSHIPSRDPPGTISTPIALAAVGSRAPLVQAAAFDRSLSYLAESPAINQMKSLYSSSYNSASSNEGSHAPTNLHLNNEDASNVSGLDTDIRNVTDGSNNPSVSRDTSIGRSRKQGSIRQQRTNPWRDSYVLKFSGWKASQPDSGLPPSLGSGSHSSGPGSRLSPLSKNGESTRENTTGIITSDKRRDDDRDFAVPSVVEANVSMATTPTSFLSSAIFSPLFSSSSPTSNFKATNERKKSGSNTTNVSIQSFNSDFGSPTNDEIVGTFFTIDDHSNDDKNRDSSGSSTSSSSVSVSVVVPVTQRVSGSSSTVVSRNPSM